MKPDPVHNELPIDPTRGPTMSSIIPYPRYVPRLPETVKRIPKALRSDRIIPDQPRFLSTDPPPEVFPCAPEDQQAVMRKTFEEAEPTVYYSPSVQKQNGLVMSTYRLYCQVNRQPMFPLSAKTVCGYMEWLAKHRNYRVSTINTVVCFSLIRMLK